MICDAMLKSLGRAWLPAPEPVRLKNKPETKEKGKEKAGTKSPKDKAAKSAAEAAGAVGSSPSAAAKSKEQDSIQDGKAAAEMADKGDAKMDRSEDRAGPVRSCHSAGSF